MHLPSHTRGKRIAPPRIVLRRTFARSGGIFNCSFFNGHDATSEKCDYPICRLQSRQIEAQATTELAKARRSTAADETTPSGSSSCQQSTSVLSKQGLLWLIMTIFLFGSSSEALSLIEKKGPYFCVEHMAPPLNSREPNNPYARCLPITYTNDPKVAHKWIKHYIAPKSVVGFDIEAVPFKSANPILREVALVQVATPREALVIQLTKGSGKPSRACHDVIQKLVEDESVIKAGCNIDGDMMGINRIWATVKPTMRFELGGVDSPGPAHVMGLKSLTQKVLRLELPKQRKLIRSNWGAEPLTEKQMEYAARDAWTAAAIAERLEEYDSSTFGFQAIYSRLKDNQPAVRDLLSRKERRKRAKKMMRSIRQARLVGGLAQKQAAVWVRELKQVIQETNFVQPERYQFHQPTDLVFAFNETGSV